MKYYQKSILVFAGFVALTIFISPAQAQEVTPLVDIYAVHFDQDLVTKGYTLASPDNTFRLGVFPNVLSKATDFVLKRRTLIDQPLPVGRQALTDYWEFDIVDKTAYNQKKPIIVQMEFASLANFVGLYFWDGQGWQELKTTIVKEDDKYLVRAFFHLPYARFLILGYDDSQALNVGQASWYKYKNCDCAASPDYPKGSKLLITNLENQKSVEVTVNDFGPDRLIHPDRAVDLDFVAFKKIAKTSQGLVNVSVQLLSLPDKL